MQSGRHEESRAQAALPIAPVPVLTGTPIPKATRQEARLAFVLALFGASLPIALAETMTKLHVARFISVSVLYRTQWVVTLLSVAVSVVAFRLAGRARSFGQARVAGVVAALASLLYFVLAVAGIIGIFFLNTAR